MYNWREKLLWKQLQPLTLEEIYKLSQTIDEEEVNRIIYKAIKDGLFSEDEFIEYLGITQVSIDEALRDNFEGENDEE